MDVQVRIARNVRRLRVSAGLSQEALAGEAEIDATYVSRIERGMENPSAGVLQRMARALKADIVELVAVPPTGKAKLATLRAGRKPGPKRKP